MINGDVKPNLNKTLDDTLNTAHISSSLINYEAARSGFFVFMPSSSQDDVIAAIVDKIQTYDAESTITADKVQEYLKLNVTKAKAPHFSVEVLEYKRGNEKVKFAGVPTFDEGSITVDDIVGIDTKSIIEAWLELTYNLDNRTGGRMYEYKMDCDLIEYTQDYRPIRTWTLSGCFISGYSEDDFDKSSDGKRAMSITIQYDRATMKRGISGKSSETNPA